MTQSVGVWETSPEVNNLGLPKRPVFRSLRRGFAGHCPHCGGGSLFRGYLKPMPECRQCGEDLSHQRADDAPPYFTMLIVGHLIVPLMVTMMLITELPNAVHLAIWLPATIALTLLLLRPVKGVIIALQWALYMHGFDPRGDPDAMPEGHLKVDATTESS
jgi:uncharacterized protein (DUF983 family)